MNTLLESSNWIEICIRIAVAILIGGVIGIEREYKNRPAGMRTHILVSIGAMSVALLESLLRANLNSIEGTLTLNLGRLSAQVISGIGFLGAGTIFISKSKIGGLTTAASLWCTACLGLMIGFGYYFVAMGIGLTVVIILSFLQKIIHVNAIKSLEIRFTHRAETMAFINDFFESMNIKVLDVDFYIDNGDNKKSAHNTYKNIYTLKLPHNVHYTTIVVHLSEYSNIQAVHTRNV